MHEWVQLKRVHLAYHLQGHGMYSYLLLFMHYSYEKFTEEDNERQKMLQVLSTRQHTFTRKQG